MGGQDPWTPAPVRRALEAALPADWELVNSSGHCSGFFAHMPSRPQDRFLTIREFGAIGNGTLNGNVLFKALVYMAKAETAGLVVGAAAPVILTSRADSAEARIASCALAVLYANYLANS